MVNSSCYVSSDEEALRDKQLNKKMEKYSWVKPENLDIEEVHRNYKNFKVAASYLNKIESYKAPRDKIICILNCCKKLYCIYFVHT